MDPRQEEIDSLKAEIERHSARLDQAIDEGDERKEIRITEYITARSNILQSLLQQQQGKVIDFPVAHVQF